MLFLLFFYEFLCGYKRSLMGACDFLENGKTVSEGCMELIGSGYSDSLESALR
jgi:hypothetical protein